MRFVRRVKARSLWTLVAVGAAYIALYTLAVTLLMPILPVARKESPQTTDVHLVQVPSRHQPAGVVPIHHSLSKRGERARNTSFSSEAQPQGQAVPRSQPIAGSDDTHHQPDPDDGSPDSAPSSNFSSSNESDLDNNFRQTELSDVFIGVKTTKKYHGVRLPVLLQTWLDDDTVRKQTYLFSDADDSQFSTAMNGHFINTHCSNRHTRQDLCCKMGVIFTAFLKSEKRWWCNVDDDNYINIGNMLSLLRTYRHDKDYYLGRYSTSSEITVTDRGDNRNLSAKASFKLKEKAKRKTSFWFATGGAGVCISRSLALKMSPYAGNGKFMDVCNRISLPDDVSIGFLVVDLLGVRMTQIYDMHSHLAMLKNLQEPILRRAITLSYKIKSETVFNCIRLHDAAFNTTVDPTRLLSLHCKLHPNAPVCSQVASKGPALPGGKEDTRLKKPQSG